jgi:flavin reductase (DIM6/NTAB) family NADH-FMN oxidoreductase RutF
VTILTVVTPDGRPIGMTANSLASVSLRPPLISVCVDREADLHDAILKAGEFVVNVLSSPQETLARRFSDEHDDRFDGVLAHIECHRHAQYPAGDHTIVVGKVVGGATGDGRPLLFYRGGYAALG